MQTNTTQSCRTLRGLQWLVPALLLFVGTAVSAATLRDASVNWTLSETQVVEMGTTDVLPNGTLSTGYTIEANAESTNSLFVSKGTLRVTLTAFTPKKDSTTQKVGIWYVRGKWQLTDIDAPPSSNPHFTPGAIDGLFQVELPFNPADGGDWSASLRLPQTVLEPMTAEQGRQPMRGDGTLIFDDQQGGVMTLNLKLWPKV